MRAGFVLARSPCRGLGGLLTPVDLSYTIIFVAKSPKKL